jgi:V/A-type H+-transporting ATPase subunit I
VVNTLHEKGLLHLEDVSTENESAPGFLDRVQLEGEDQAAFVKLEESERALNEIAPLLTLAPGALDVQSATQSIAGMPEAEIHTKVMSWSDQLRAVTRERTQSQDAIEVLKNYKGILEQVSPALGGANVKLGKGTRALVLNGNTKKIVARLDERLRDEIGAGANFHRNQVSRRQVVGLLTFPPDKEDQVSRILGQEGITPVDMRDQGFGEATLSEVLARIDKTVAHHNEIVQKSEGAANKLSRQFGAELLGAKAVVADRLARLRVQGQFAESQMVTVIEGWAPEQRFGELVKTVQTKFPGQVEVNQVPTPENALPPTLLANPPLFKPFEVILKLFAPPTYGTVDPTIMIAFSFILFYGFIVGDVVYGAVIILAALWLGKKWKNVPAIQDASKIGVYMGISSIFFGVLFGEYAGEVIPEMLGIPYLWFHRGHEQIKLLIYALYLGIVHILLALSLGVYENYKHHHMHHAIEKLGMLFGVSALIIFSFGFFEVAPFNSTPALVLAGVLFVVGAGLILKELGPMMGSVGVLEILSLGGNIVSYARLMALGLAAIAIADIANGLPEAFGPVIGIPAAILVHLVNIGISMASPTIHALRLNFVEFLPKFYAPAGRVFNPFKKETMS